MWTCQPLVSGKLMTILSQAINILGDYCGVRDIDDLTQTALEQSFGFNQADIMVLFGGTIISGADVFAKAMQAKLAKTTIIVGGAGHTTDTLRQKMAPLLNTDTSMMTEG